MTDSAAVERETFGKQWLLLLVVAALCIGFYYHTTRLPTRAAPGIPSGTTSTDWFLLLRMPAVTSQYESGIATMQERYGAWLEALQTAGFHPILLSQAQQLLKEGRGVPANSIALVFDPGFRRTFEIVSPILAQHGWPATWITPQKEMDSGHREYITYHKARQMVSSGNWEVGFVRKDGSVSLQSQGQETVELGQGGSPWSPTAGGVALNHPDALSRLERLNVIGDWTPKDLVNRVRVEVPIDEPRFLVKDSVQNLEWGVTTPLRSGEEKHFDLSVPVHRRGTQIAWFGTRRLANFELKTQFDSLIGNLAIRLRWNELQEAGIILVISNQEILVQSKGLERTLLLKKLTRSGAGPRRPLEMNVVVQGNTINIALDGRAPVTIDLPDQTPKTGGLVQLYLYDSLKGSARANSLKLQLTPIQ